MSHFNVYQATLWPQLRAHPLKLCSIMLFCLTPWINTVQWTPDDDMTQGMYTSDCFTVSGSKHLPFTFIDRLLISVLFSIPSPQFLKWFMKNPLWAPKMWTIESLKWHGLSHVSMPVLLPGTPSFKLNNLVTWISISFPECKMTFYNSKFK